MTCPPTALRSCAGKPRRTIRKPCVPSSVAPSTFCPAGTAARRRCGSSPTKKCGASIPKPSGGIIASQLWNYGEDNLFTYPGFAWPDVKAGLLAWIGRSSGRRRQQALNIAACTAQGAGERTACASGWRSSARSLTPACGPPLACAPGWCSRRPSPQLIVAGYGNLSRYLRYNNRVDVPLQEGTFGMGLVLRHLTCPATVQMVIEHPRIVKPDGQATTRDVSTQELKPGAISLLSELHLRSQAAPRMGEGDVDVHGADKDGHVAAKQRFQVH